VAINACCVEELDTRALDVKFHDGRSQ
jgi:hypothetical protein